jgi:hypothetical protein
VQIAQEQLRRLLRVEPRRPHPRLVSTLHSADVRAGSEPAGGNDTSAEARACPRSPGRTGRPLRVPTARSTGEWSVPAPLPADSCAHDGGPPAAPVQGRFAHASSRRAVWRRTVADMDGADKDVEHSEDFVTAPFRKPRRLWWLVSVALVVIAAVVAVYRRHDLAAASHLIAAVRMPRLVLVAGFEAASLGALIALQQWLLRMGGARLRLRVVGTIVLAANAVAGALPGGAAFAAAWMFTQFRRRGVGRVLAGAVLAVSGVLSAAALFALLVAGALASGSAGLGALRPVVLGLAAVLGVPVGAVAGLSRFAPVRRRVWRLGGGSGYAFPAAAGRSGRPACPRPARPCCSTGAAPVVAALHVRAAQLGLRRGLPPRLRVGAGHRRSLARGPRGVHAHPDDGQPAADAGRSRCGGGQPHSTTGSPAHGPGEPPARLLIARSRSLRSATGRGPFFGPGGHSGKRQLLRPLGVRAGGGRIPAGQGRGSGGVRDAAVFGAAVGPLSVGEPVLSRQLFTRLGRGCCCWPTGAFNGSSCGRPPGQLARTCCGGCVRARLCPWCRSWPMALSSARSMSNATARAAATRWRSA